MITQRSTLTVTGPCRLTKEPAPAPAPVPAPRPVRMADGRKAIILGLWADTVKTTRAILENAKSQDHVSATITHFINQKHVIHAMIQDTDEAIERPGFPSGTIAEVLEADFQRIRALQHLVRTRF